MHHHPHLPHPLHRITTALLATLIAGLFTAIAAAQNEQEPSLASKIVVLEVSEFTLVEEAQSVELQSNLQRAQQDGATAIVLEIDSPGGLAISTRRTIDQLGRMDGIKTYAFIKGKAFAGAALVALACDEIHFAPDGVMGTADEVRIDWRGPKKALPPRLVEKTYADYATTMKEVIAAKGRDPILLDGFIDPSTEVKLGDEVLSEPDDVLVLKAGNPVSSGTASDTVELVDAAGLEGDLEILLYEPPLPADEDEAEVEPEAKPSSPFAAADAGDGEDQERGFGETRLENYAGKVVVIEVGKESLIRQTKFRFMERILDKAVEDGAEAIIFDMRTPGGYLFETRDLMNKLQDIEIPTYTFVNPEASSAGSMIAIATDKIYMKKPSTIGAAAIVAGGQGLDGTMKEKVEQTFIDTVAQVAEANGRDPQLCMAFVKLELEYYATIPTVEPDGKLWERSVLSVGEGKLLSLSATEALQLVDGKPLFADGTAQTIEELVEKENLSGGLVRTRPLGFERVADWIVKLAPLLLLLAIAGVYLEANSPGFGVPGIVALISFAIFFFGHHVAGKLAGYEVIGVFLIGLLLIAVELFVIPGTLIAGALGLLLVVGSLLFAMIDKFDFRVVDGSFDLDRFFGGLSTPVWNLIIGLIGASLLVMFLMRYLPELPIVRRRMLAGVTSGGPGATAVQASGERSEIIGLVGTAHCDLRPVGKGKFGDQILDITTETEFLDAGTAVRIISEEGGRVIVEKV